ncbi:MAG: hypothetical protein ABWZ88_11670 [Variovorax sp.]
MNALHAERDAVALEMLLALGHTRDAIHRAMVDGLLPEPLWLTSQQPLLAYLDDVVARGTYALRPLSGATATLHRHAGAAPAEQSWRAAFDTSKF